MTRLVTRGLGVRRGTRRILDAISIELSRGLVVVLGPNGAGKSTLLACLAGLQPIDEGAIEVDGTPLGAIPPRRLARQRAYLPQHPHVEWPVSVERLVALGLAPEAPMFGPQPAAHARRLEQILASLDLTHLRHQPATTLSGGELARTMLARAIVGAPAILLVDEPLAGLDPRHALDGIARLRGLANEGTLVVMALHDLTLAARYADQALLLKGGRLQASGPPRAVMTDAVLSALYEVPIHVSAVGMPGAVVTAGGARLR